MIGYDKYEEINIVAENNDITDLEEVIYLNKSMKELDADNLCLYNELVKVLAKYNRTIEDLSKTDGFVISELINLLHNINAIYTKVDDYQNAIDIEKYKKKGAIMESLIDIIKYPRNYMLAEVNNQLGDGKRIKGAVCVSKLLNIFPESIYQRIQKEVNTHEGDMNDATLNLFIDYLFDLAFSYIKYDLTRLVAYFDFIFTEKYLENQPEIKDKIVIIEEIFLKRLRIFRCDNNHMLKILIDLDLPYKDAKEIGKLLIEMNQETLSTSKVLDMMELKFDDIIKSRKINNVTKDLVRILLKR